MGIRRYSLYLIFACFFLASLSSLSQDKPPALPGAQPASQPKQVPAEPAPLNQAQPVPAPPELPQLPAQAPRLQEGSYLFIQRTHGHVKFSDPETFHRAATAIKELFRQQNISIVEDPLRGTLETSEEFSLPSVLKLARDAGATHLLYVRVERPVTKWLKIRVQCYDLNGRMLWEESASHGGGWNSGKSLEKITAELGRRLSQRAGGPGLPRTPAVPEGKQEEPGGARL